MGVKYWRKGPIYTSFRKCGGSVGEVYWRRGLAMTLCFSLMFDICNFYTHRVLFNSNFVLAIIRIHTYLSLLVWRCQGNSMDNFGITLFL